MATVQTLSIAVCICHGVTLSDFIPPVELIGYINKADDPMFGAGMGDVPYRVKIDYLAPTLDPIVSTLGCLAPKILPTHTYEDVMKSGVQYDVLWVPAGPIMDPTTGEDTTPPMQIEFIKQQAPGAKYVCSVCYGAAQLAMAGVLEGKRATTNKTLFRLTEKMTAKHDITWVAKARWVVDGNIWTSSGVTAGSDMALAFIEHLVGPMAARHIRGIFEVIEHKEDDDPFAVFYGLV